MDEIDIYNKIDKSKPDATITNTYVNITASDINIINNTNDTKTSDINNSNETIKQDNEIYSVEYAFFEEKLGLEFKFEKGNVILSGISLSNI